MDTNPFDMLERTAPASGTHRCVRLTAGKLECLNAVNPFTHGRLLKSMNREVNELC
jgi:hypothetical protein